MIQAIVFLPLLAALVAGLGQRAIGPFASKLITTGALFTSAALSWPVFLSFVMGSGEAEVVTVLHWVS
ncbi:MAG: NADH-quinone oxidoreductase subunit L, partial [Afipia sp.]|nr:NADH-quinone oxidoreductase subunit L [Afipia sp.]